MLFAVLRLFDEVDLLTVFLEEFDAKVFIFAAELLVQLSLRMVWHEVPHLYSGFLTCECQRCSDVFDDALVKVALVDEDEALRGQEAEENLVKHAKLGEGEEENDRRQHDPVLDRLSLRLLALACVARQQGQTTVKTDRKAQEPEIGSENALKV